ncbi:hypothetical protein E4U53_001487 [Claviceps sorghi]|nr:hypothetical protein E4U53_001487 [Claviceps sorghi]
MSQAISPRPTHQLVSPTHTGSSPLQRGPNDCGEGQHSCLDIQRPDSCCDNASYCYINAQDEARCCPIGSNCIADSPCSSQAYYCTVTLTTTFLPRVSSAGVTAVTTTEQGCCGRKCPQTSYFLCPPDLGGKCCPFGSQCQAGGSCLQKKTATSASTSAAIATPKAGCSSPASSCPETPTDDQDDSSSSDASDNPALTAAVKAGVGICVSITLLVVLTAACLYLRRRHRQRSKKADMISRVELTGCAARPRHDHHAQHHAASAAPRAFAPATDDGMPRRPRHHTAPVEMASVEAVSPVSQGRTYPNWTCIQPECPGGYSELEGSPAYTAEQHLPSP